MKKTRLYINKTAAVLALIIIALTFASCTSSTEDDGRLKVIATVFPQYDFARQISGGAANVEMLVMPGGDTHSYEFPPRDMVKIRSCDLFIYIGGDSDQWIRDMLSTMEEDKPRVLALTEIINPVEEITVSGMAHEHNHNHSEPEYDEHVWTSPKNAIMITAQIANYMAELDSENADTYLENAQKYIEELDALDADFHELAKKSLRNTLVFGDRFPFRYFADEYGFEYFAAFSGCSTETEPSAAGMTYLIDKINAEKIPVVFTIEFSNKKIAKTLSEETGAEILELHSCHNVSKSDYNDGVTYAELMRRNFENIKTALN